MIGELLPIAPWALFPPVQDVAQGISPNVVWPLGAQDDAAGKSPPAERLSRAMSVGKQLLPAAKDSMSEIADV